jgi:predicted transcriptional regulator of viral defense system
MQNEKKVIPVQWEFFLHALSDNIAEPTENQLTVRCWTLTSLAKVIQKIKKMPELTSTFPNTPEILKHLRKIGWAYPIDVEVQPTIPSRSKEFYLLDIGAAHGTKVDPLELLQAYKPDGVICYFSALTYYSLTTQIATHHHIAALRKKASALRSDYDMPLTDKSNESITSNRKNSLGKKQFIYQDIPFYLIQRSTSRMIGLQIRMLGPRTNIRITTLEQTLLDTLHKPIYCGGPPVVFEAWEEGITRIDEDLLNDYLQKIDSSLILRRVGAMLEMFDFRPSKEFETTLEKGLESSSRNSATTVIPILPGYEFTSLNSKWKVMTP